MLCKIRTLPLKNIIPGIEQIGKFERNIPMNKKSNRHKSENEKIQKRKNYNLDEMMIPFWCGDIIYNESVLMVKYDDMLPEANLLFEPEKIISIKNLRLDVEYQEVTDWIYKNGKITLPMNSYVPYLTYKELYPADPVPDGTMERIGGGYVLFREGHYFHDMQLAVTYKKSSTPYWKGPIPKYEELSMINTKNKLKNSMPLKILLYGDSISVGLNASGCTGVPPFLPGWGQLVADKLNQVYGSTVIFENPSVSGQTSQWGAENVRSLVAVKNPDLVIIAFGMNDGTGKVPGSTFRKNICYIISEITAINPDTEFILVAPILANPETYFAADQASYKQELDSLRGKGIIVIDMTGIHSELLKYKKFSDMTGNNINHPNDYLARWYAQEVFYTLAGYLHNCMK